MGEESESKSPTSRWRWLLENEKFKLASQRKYGHVWTIFRQPVFVNYVPEDAHSITWWTTEDKEKAKCVSHLSHSPPHLEDYNQSRRDDFEKGLPKALEKLQEWCDIGGIEADPRFCDDTSDESEDSDEEEEQEKECYENMSQAFALLQEAARQLLEDKRSDSSSDRTEEATVISDDSAIAKATPSNGGTVETFTAEEDIDEEVKQVMDEIVDRVTKAHEKMKKIRQKMMSLNAGG